jgi:AraC-binding-like domain
VGEAIERIYAKPVLVPARGAGTLDTTINNCRLQAVDLTYRAFGAPMGLEFPATEFVVLQFPMCGRGEITTGRMSIGVTAGIGAVTPSDEEHKSSYSADYAHLLLRIRSRVLTEKLLAMTGAAINQPLRMNPQQSFESATAQMLQTVSAASPRNIGRGNAAVSRLVDRANRAVCDHAGALWPPAQLQSPVRAGHAGRGTASGQPSRGIHRSQCAARHNPGRARRSDRREHSDTI